MLLALEEVAYAPGSDEKDAPVKLSSKLKALELLGKSMGLFEGNAGRSLPPVTILDDVTEGVKAAPAASDAVGG